MGTFAQNMKATASAIALLATLGLAPGTALANEKHGHGAPAGATTTTAGAVSIVRSPTDLPPPLAKRGPERVRVSLETVEITGQLDDGTTYHYWTFNSKVPGPFVRVRVGDTVEVTMKNHDESTLMHNVDFHAVTGPGGGGMATEAMPGETKGFVFKR